MEKIHYFLTHSSFYDYMVAPIAASCVIPHFCMLILEKNIFFAWMLYYLDSQ